MAPLPVPETLAKRYFYYSYDYTPRNIGIGVGVGVLILLIILIILSLYLNRKKKQKKLAERARIAELERQIAELHGLPLGGGQVAELNGLPLGGDQPAPQGGVTTGDNVHGGVEKTGTVGVQEVSQPLRVYNPHVNGTYAPEIQGMPRNTAIGSELPSYR